MFDQLARLIENASASCSAESPHCARLESVKNVLLVPFPSREIKGDRRHTA